MTSKHIEMYTGWHLVMFQLQVDDQDVVRYRYVNDDVMKNRFVKPPTNVYMAVRNIAEDGAFYISLQYGQHGQTPPYLVVNVERLHLTAPEAIELNHRTHGAMKAALKDTVFSQRSEPVGFYPPFTAMVLRFMPFFDIEQISPGFMELMENTAKQLEALASKHDFGSPAHHVYRLLAKARRELDDGLR